MFMYISIACSSGFGFGVAGCCGYRSVGGIESGSLGAKEKSGSGKGHRETGAVAPAILSKRIFCSDTFGGIGC